MVYANLQSPTFIMFFSEVESVQSLGECGAIKVQLMKHEEPGNIENFKLSAWNDREGTETVS